MNDIIIKMFSSYENLSKSEAKACLDRIYLFAAVLCAEEGMGIEDELTNDNIQELFDYHLKKRNKLKELCPEGTIINQEMENDIIFPVFIAGCIAGIEIYKFIR